MPWAITPRGAGEKPRARRVKALDSPLAPGETFIVADDQFNEGYRLNATSDGVRPETPQEKTDRENPSLEKRIENIDPFLEGLMEVYAEDQGVTLRSLQNRVRTKVATK